VIEESLLAGRTDSEGLFMAWADWQMEIRLIEESFERRQR
jgi:hypothetical protein